jgi:hypothetical protein
LSTHHTINITYRTAKVKPSQHHTSEKPFFPRPNQKPGSTPGKKEPHIHIPAGFWGSGGIELHGEKCLDTRGLGKRWEKAFPPVFWQTGHEMNEFSTGTETEGLSGFSGIRIG